MATVTGRRGKGNDRLKCLKKLRDLAKEEHEEACDAFREDFGKDTFTARVAWRELLEGQKRLTEINNEFMEVAAASYDKDELKEEGETKRRVFRKFYECEALYEDQHVKVSTTAQPSQDAIRLPRLEIRTFDGAPNNWLPFWHQFKRIHEDKNITKADKLQYLLQFSSGKVRELVAGYPQLEENYDKILEHVRDRYGNSKLLIRFYVRELLKLVVDSKQKINIEQLQQSLETKVRALETLGVTQDQYGNFLLPLVEAALPENLLMLWHRHGNAGADAERKSNNEGELESILKFLRQEVSNRNRVQEAGFSFSTKRVPADNPQTTAGKGGTASALVNTSEPQNNCLFCDKNNHQSMKCLFAKKWNLKDRKRVALKKNACFCCLKIGHRANQCKAEVTCQICAGKHAALLCEKAEENKENTLTCLSSVKSKINYLPTVLVKVVANEQVKTARALIDSGCQRSYVLEKLAKNLELKPVGQETLTNCLFGGVVSKSKIYNLYSVVLVSVENKFRIRLDVLGEESLCNYIPSIEEEVAEKFPEIELSDVDQKASISLVLGADVFGKIFTGVKSVSKNGMTALETKLGWVLTGPRENAGLNVANVCLKNSVLPDLWELEALGIEEPTDKISDKGVVTHFLENVRRSQLGRYTVALPWLSDHMALLDNKELAEKRLKRTTRRLRKNKLYQAYQSVLKEWEDLDITEVVPKEELEKAGHYLPHRPVVKMAKETTKVRPVFDASCHEEGFPSLNDCLSKGPNLLKLIIPLLIKFRLYKYGLIADIEKAFLQIGVIESDRNFLRFLWWNSENPNELEVYRHKRLVFGVCCSPFLLNATIEHHLKEYKKINNEALETVDKLASSLYVDDCVLSVESLDEVKRFMSEAERIMSDACFNLRGWKYNDREWAIETGVKDTTVLGIGWNLFDGTIKCAFEDIKLYAEEPITKRKLLSMTNKIFDPLGILSPVTVVLKLLLQQMWKNKIDWDEELPVESINKLRVIIKNWDLLQECRIPRWVVGESLEWERCTLHVFCDASSSAYAACVFLRSEGRSEVRARLLVAKSRVAPLKEITIPRLELLGALIGTRLAMTVSNALPVKLPVTFWTDSRVVLAWIKRKDSWNVFVRNRVEEIRRYTESGQWRHVPGDLNPADLPSRGCNIEKFMEKQWWDGPNWLLQNSKEWPQECDEAMDESEIVRERKKGVCLIAVKSESLLDSFIYYFSRFNRIVRMCAWMLRFSLRLKLLCKLRKVGKQTEKDELQLKLNELTGELSGEEIISAEITLLKLLQQECVDEKELRTFVGLRLFKDEQGLIRVQSRLTQGLDEDYFQSPIVLVRHILVERLIFEQHLNLSHAGVAATLAQLRERYFIIRGRQLTRKMVKSCVTCKRLLGKPCVVAEAPLPRERITRVAAFQVSGVDLGGPLFIRKGKKVWFALFTCAVYRAVHLELVDSLSTEAFIMALRRFLARRGRIRTLYSDQGTNFVGANNLFRRLNRDLLRKECSLRRIVWKFNIPSAPWWGGWWERLVGLVKIALRKTLGRAYLNYVELETVLCDIESIINNRPLTYLSEDPKDLSVITPAHFIQDFPGSGQFDLDEIDRKFMCSRNKYVQSIRTHLRERFKKEYLAELVNRRDKGWQESSTLSVGDVVLVEDNQKKRLYWPLARVLEMIPGRDGKPRVAKLQLAKGQLTRAVQRLYPLEVGLKKSTEVIRTRSGRAVKTRERMNL